jgi:tetratricopeptide (TPR) repeat protein
MEDAFRIASNEFNTSLSLDEKPILTYLHAIDISSFLGNPNESRRLLNQAIKVDPHTFIVREKYMGTLQSRWGGSVEEMKAFLSECRKAQLSSLHLNSLEGLVIEEEGWNHQHQEGNTDAAVRDYLKAAKLRPEGSCAPCGPIGQAACILIKEKKYSEAIPLYSKVLSIDPNSTDALRNRGFSQLQLGKTAEAIADLTRAAELGDAYSQDTLARQYLMGNGVPKDRDEAIKLLQKAADQGYAPAQQLLPIAKDKNIPLLPMPNK